MTAIAFPTYTLQLWESQARLLQTASGRAFLCEDSYEIPLWTICTFAQRWIERYSAESAFSQKRLVFFIRIGLHA